MTRPVFRPDILQRLTVKSDTGWWEIHNLLHFVFRWACLQHMYVLIGKILNRLITLAHVDTTISGSYAIEQNAIALLFLLLCILICDVKSRSRINHINPGANPHWWENAFDYLDFREVSRCLQRGLRKTRADPVKFRHNCLYHKKPCVQTWGSDSSSLR